MEDIRSRIADRPEVTFTATTSTGKTFSFTSKLNLQDSLAVLADSREKISDFISDLISRLYRYHKISTSQEFWIIQAAERLLNPVKREDRTFEVGLAISDALATASKNGLKWPALTFELDEVVQFKMAGRNSKYAGSVMVTDGEPFGSNKWYGWIKDGIFHATEKCREATTELVKQLSDDFETALDEYGLKTGRCACCNRKLTAEESTNRGVGPVCAARFGLRAKEVIGNRAR